jgi:hypothetical protein
MPLLEWFLGDEIWIVPYAPDPGIRPRPYRVIMGIVVPGATFAADEMPGNLWHWHALR